MNRLQKRVIEPLANSIAGGAVQRMKVQGQAADVARAKFQLPTSQPLRSSGFKSPQLQTSMPATRRNPQLASNARMQGMIDSVYDKGLPLKKLGSFKKGGKVKKTGMYQLHKDEKVVPAPKKSKIKLTIKK